MYYCVTPDDGQRDCPKHVEFHSKNTFEKLVHLVGFVVRIVRNLIRRFLFSFFVLKSLGETALCDKCNR